MESGQKLFLATAGYHDRAYAHVGEYECVGRIEDLVAIRRYDGSVDMIPAEDAFPTHEGAKAACVAKLRARRDKFNRDIDAEIARLETQS